MIPFGAIVTAAAYTAVVVLSYTLLLIGYRTWLHPLSKYHGPWLATVTDAYGGLYSLLMRLHLATYRDHARYGPVMRHGPNKLVFNTATALHDIYNNDRVTKSHVYLLTVNSPGVFSIFNAIDKHQHRIRRKLIGQAVTERSMRAFEPTMMSQIDIFLQRLVSVCANGESIPSVPVNMTERCKRLGIDIVGLLAFGYKLNTQTDSKYHFILRGLSAGNYKSNSFMQFPLLKKLKLDSLLHVLSMAQRKRYLRMMETMISQRLAQDTHAQNDLYSFVAHDIDTGGGGGIRVGQLWTEALFFFPAGGDTTATALSALFFYLSRNPEVYKKLATEIRTTFVSGADVRGGPKLSSCRYLRACIDETLRVSPPVTGTLWRELAAEEVTNPNAQPFTVDGHVIPPGTQVGVNIYTLHHNPAYFSDPFSFQPERWLEADEEKLKKMNSAFCPFSLGARGCAGKAMAYLEISLVVAKTLWYFDFEPAEGEIGRTGCGHAKNSRIGRGRPDEFQLYDIFSSTHNGPVLTFEKRDEFWRELN
ncbi:Cytochrome P450 [Naviculisporaceae sp. PSN 640]